MADVIQIKAERRDRVGKGASRAARRQGYVPAVIYGGKQDPESIQIPQNVIVSLINRGGFMSHTYDVEVDGKATRVLPRDLQLHPVSDEPQHIDFLRLVKGATIVMDIPVVVIGEETSPGLKRGGVINHVRHDIELEVPADAIPESITISVDGLDIGDAAKISDVTLPKGVVPTITDRDFTILAIVAPSGLKSKEGAAADEADDDAEVETTKDAEGGED